PPSLEETPSALLAMLTGSDGRSVEALAAGYQRQLLAALDRLAGDRIVGTPDAGAQAQWLNLLLRQPRPRPDDALANFTKEEEALTAEIKTVSRLAMAMLD